MGGSRDYEYAVASVNDEGVSGMTNQFRALVPANYISDAETWRSHSLTATRSGSVVTLNWEVISTTKVLGYKIRRKTAGGRWQSLVAEPHPPPGRIPTAPSGAGDIDTRSKPTMIL